MPLTELEAFFSFMVVTLSRFLNQDQAYLGRKMLKQVQHNDFTGSKTIKSTLPTF